MERDDLLERYEALGDERDFQAAKPLFEQALAAGETPHLLSDYGYLLIGHGRNELRRAVELLERAIELDPGFDKPRYQLISAFAALGEPERSVASCEAWLSASPRDVRAHRFLVYAQLANRDYPRALAVAQAGLSILPDDPALVAGRGEAKAGLGDPEAALADWQRALELEPEDIGALYSTAFLLERERRLEEAATAWQKIIDWNDARGYTLQTDWPRQERDRIRAAIASEPEEA
jgi:tetratricopeptide (TPR) repeat protein